MLLMITTITNEFLDGISRIVQTKKYSDGSVFKCTKIAIVISYGAIASFMLGCIFDTPSIVAISGVVGIMSFVTACVADV